MTTEPTTSTAELTAVSGHAEWMRLAGDAYQRLADAFETLGPDDWARPTPCEGWTVRDMAGHVVGAMRRRLVP